MRKAIIAAGAIVALGGAAMLAIWLVTRGGPGSQAASPQLPEGGQPASEVPLERPLPAIQLGGRIGGVPPSPPQVYEPPPPKPPPGSWEAVTVTARAAALGPVGAAVDRELGELQPQLSACFDEVTQSRYGQTGFSRTQDRDTPNETGTTVFLLQLETSAGKVRIVDAPLETQGTASDGLVACAQRVLRGRVIDAPEAKTGQRARLIFPLFQ